MNFRRNFIRNTMQTKFLGGLCLAAGIFMNLDVSAQETSDSLQYRQAKLEIWCETIQFVYQDNGADSLRKTLNCKDWESLRQSIQPNHLQAYSFFQSIEKPSIYQGYSTYDAKLAKLVDEIGKKLKSSPSRTTNSSRLRKVDSLESALRMTALASSGSRGSNTVSAISDEQKGEANSNQLALVLSRQENINLSEGEEEPMDWIEIAQWALLLLLSAGFALLWVKNNQLQKELNERMNRRKQEISAISRLKETTTPASVIQKSESLTKPDVQNMVKAEIEKLRQQQKALRQEQLSKTKQVEIQRKEQEPAQPQPTEKQQVSRSPEPETLQPALKEEGVADPGLYYDKLPFKGGFHQSQLSTHRHPDSIYSIQVLANKPDEAEFWVTEDHEVQKYAMQNGLSFFEEACEYKQVEENPSRVRNLEKGKLRKNGHLWQIEKKVKVNFE